MSRKPPAALATVFGNSMFCCFGCQGAALADAPGGPWLTAWTAPASPMSPSTRTIRDAGSAVRSSGG